MARQRNSTTPQPYVGTCRECALHHDDHEHKADHPHDFFLTCCPIPNRWGRTVSKFLDKQCDCGHFTPINTTSQKTE